MGDCADWVSEFAPPSCQKVLSYISGWLSALGWQVRSNRFLRNTANYLLATARDIAMVSCPA